MELTGHQRKIAIDFLSASFAKQDLIEFLRNNIGFDPRNILEDRANRAYCSSLLDHAVSRGWCRLLLVCALADVPGTGSNEVARELLPELFTVAIPIIRTIRSTFGKKACNVVKSCYHSVECSFEGMAGWKNNLYKFEKNDLTLIYLVLSKEENLSESGAVRDSKESVLWWFLCHVYGAYPADERAALQDCWHSLEVPGIRKEDLTEPKDILSSSASVLILLQESTQPNHYLCRTYRHNKQDDIVPLDLEDASTVHTPHTRKQVEELFSRLVETFRAEGAFRTDLLFEFVVTPALLHLAVDQWMVVMGLARREVPIGREHPIVIRLHNHPLKEKVLTRWRVNGGQNTFLNQGHFTEHVRVADDSDDNPYEEFDDSEDLMCLVSSTPICCSDDILQNAAVVAAIDSGVPIIVWARNEEAAAILESKVKEVVDESPRQIWERAWQRIRREQGPLKENLTLIFEQEHFLPREQRLVGARDQ